MRKLLAAKAAKRATPAATLADEDGHQMSAEKAMSPELIEDSVVDPWPELPLSCTALGVEDGKRRAVELTRRGDFSGACRMWAKVHFIAGRAKPPMSTAAIAEVEACWESAKQNAPPSEEPPPAASPQQFSSPPNETARTNSLPTATTRTTARAIAKQAEQEARTGDNASFDPEVWNQAFFTRMEQDYDDLCASDGWDDIRRRQKELEQEGRR